MLTRAEGGARPTPWNSGGGAVMGGLLGVFRLVFRAISNRPDLRT